MYLLVWYMYMYLPYSTNLTSYCTAPSPLHTYMYLSACLRHATPRHTLLYSTRARATPDCLLRRPAWGIPSGSSLVWNFGRDTYTHYITRLPALGPHRERTLITSSCMYLLMGTYMLSIVEPPSTTPFITSFPSPHRAARRADGRHSTRKPSTTTPVRLVHLSHR